MIRDHKTTYLAIYTKLQELRFLRQMVLITNLVFNIFSAFNLSYSKKRIFYLIHFEVPITFATIKTLLSHQVLFIITQYLNYIIFKLIQTSILIIKHIPTTILFLFIIPDIHSYFIILHTQKLVINQIFF